MYTKIYWESDLNLSLGISVKSKFKSTLNQILQSKLVLAFLRFFNLEKNNDQIRLGFNFRGNLISFMIFAPQLAKNRK